MNPLEITLILLGIIIIAISCKIIDHSQDRGSKSAGGTQKLDNHISEEELQRTKEKMNRLLSEVSEETVIRTDDSLSKISNEKIMAVNEFSDQILEKIKRNHEEVVFLYNMLNDKEKELKAVVREIDSSKKKVQDIIDSKKDALKTQTSKKTMTTQAAAVSASQAAKLVKPEQRPQEEISDTITLSSLSSNNNTQILSLFSQGKSVIEISRLLGLGQGEVKLVIDLFKGKK